MERLTVAEAADRLGVTRDAIRKRIKRDSIRWETGSNGEPYVYVADASSGVADASGHEEMHALVESLEDQVSYLRKEVAVWQEEARRKDHLLAAALERIPELEGPSETESTRTATGGGSEAPASDTEHSRPSWWQWLFGT